MDILQYLHAPRLFFVLAVSLVVLMASVWVHFIVSDRTRVLKNAERQLLSLTNLRAGHVQRTIEGSDIVLRQLERQLENEGLERWLLSGDPHQKLRYAANSLPQIGHIYIMSADATNRASSVAQEPLPGTFNDRDYFAASRARRDQTPYIGSRLVGRTTGVEFFTISRRLDDFEGHFVGVLVAGIRVDNFQRNEMYPPSLTGASIAIVRTDGAALSMEPPAEYLPDFIPHLLARPVPGVQTIMGRVGGARDEAQVVAIRPVEAFPVTVVASWPKALILAVWRQRLILGSLIVASLTAATAVLAVAGLRGLRRQEVMAAALLESHASLERRVAERTAELATSNDELTRALADKNLLLSEVHHRVKNNLQLVEALLALQSARAEGPAQEALDAARRRINTLGIVHQQLMGNGGDGTVRMMPFFHKLVELLALSFGATERGIRADVTGDDVDVPMDIAIPLALVANEALSNAFKHAFPGEHGGTVTLYLRVDDERLRLSVRDDGTGLAGPKRLGADQSATLGNQIIRSLVGQLSGELAFRSDHGTHIDVDVPLKEKKGAV